MQNPSKTPAALAAEYCQLGPTHRMEFLRRPEVQAVMANFLAAVRARSAPPPQPTPSPDGIIAQLQAIKDPTERTRFFRANKARIHAAYDAAKQPRK
jgi:hypothetical protein